MMCYIFVKESQVIIPLIISIMKAVHKARISVCTQN